jgi:hypothetical protein
MDANGFKGGSIQPVGAQSPAKLPTGNLLVSKLPPFSESGLKDSLIVVRKLMVMWIDDTSADVIKADFEALYHGDVLVEGETSEQFDDWQHLLTAS